MSGDAFTLSTATARANDAPTAAPTVAPSTTASPLPTVNRLLNFPSDAAVRVGDLPGWHQGYAEDFVTEGHVHAIEGPVGARRGALHTRV